MKRNIRKLIALPLLALLVCSCGEDRSGEYYELTQENQWIYYKMKEVYLWADAIGEIKQNIFFSTPSQFFKKLLYTDDKTSFFTDTLATTSYGITTSLMRDPLGITPSKTYALIEFVEPGSVAETAGLERGMWISEIDGSRLTTSSAAKLSAGTGVEVTVQKMEFDDVEEIYYWEEKGNTTLSAATEIKSTSIPATAIIDDISSKSGYILCNTFDGEEAADALGNALSTMVAEGVDNIILDLRYNNTISLADAAAASAPFVPADRQGTPFCSLAKAIDSDEHTELLIPASNINVSNNPLYIITTTRTKGVTNAFVKAVQATRANVKVVGQKASGANLYTECYESPYLFKINPATAYIFDIEGEPLQPALPDYAVAEYDNYRSIYPLGAKQEHILNNISYIIANGTLPPTE